MAFTDINSEDRLVQKTFADHLQDVLGWDSLYAWNQETFGPEGVLGRSDTKDVVLTRDLREAIARFNKALPEKAVNEAIEMLTRQDFSRSALQRNQEFHNYIRNGVPVSYRDAKGQVRQAFARVIDFRNPEDNRFLCVRELKITGLRTPNYNRRADLVCFVNGLLLVFIELCHTAHSPETYSVNQWPGELDSMADYGGLMGDEPVLVRQYLQTHAKTLLIHRPAAPEDEETEED